jgi:hypothetical protein
MPMPPPVMGSKKPKAIIAVGIAKPKMGPPKMGGDEPPADAPEDEQGGAKHSREEAHFIPADKHCRQCSNWDATSGDCKEVDGVFDSEDCCISYFDPMGEGDDEESEPDEGTPTDADEGMESQEGM